MKRYTIFLILLLSYWSTVANNKLIKNTFILKYHLQGIENSAAKKNVETALNTAQGDEPLSIADGSIFYHDAPNLIKQALQPFGYFSPHIQSQLVKNKTQWDAYFIVQQGPLLPIANIDIKIFGAGKADIIFAQFLQNLPLKVGQPFTTDSYQNMKQSLFLIANSNGYINASLIKHEVVIDTRNYLANITLHFNTGSRYYFGEVTIEPNFFTDDFLKRFAPFYSDNVYSPQKLLNFQQNLSGSNYFKQVIVSPKLEAAKKNQVPIEVKVIPTKKFLYSLGPGYGTDTGIRGNLGFQWRHITPNGQYFSSNLFVSQIGTAFTSNYFIPGNNPVNDRYSLTASLSTSNTALGKTNTQNYGGGLTTSQGRWRKMYNLIFVQEVYQLKGKSGSHSRLLMPGVDFYYVNTDNIIQPTHGLAFGVTLRGATQYAISTVDFAQLTLRNTWIQPISYNNRFILKIKLGATANKNFDALPLSLRFNAGGAESIRGYSYQSLGPGQYLFTGSGELQQRIYKNYYIGIFYDTGNAFMNIKHPELKTSVGPALIWAAPIGNIKLSFAKALDLPGKPWAVQFSMGSLL